MVAGRKLGIWANSNVSSCHLEYLSKLTLKTFSSSILGLLHPVQFRDVSNSAMCSILNAAHQLWSNGSSVDMSLDLREHAAVLHHSYIDLCSWFQD